MEKSAASEAALPSCNARQRSETLRRAHAHRSLQSACGAQPYPEGDTLLLTNREGAASERGHAAWHLPRGADPLTVPVLQLCRSQKLRRGGAGTAGVGVGVATL